MDGPWVTEYEQKRSWLLTACHRRNIVVPDMSLAPGTKLLHYEMIESLGAASVQPAGIRGGVRRARATPS